MAIYHLSVKMISRSKGKTAIAAAAYRSASKLENKNNKIVFDYSKKRGVEYSEIFAPEHAPLWVKDRETLWNEVERSETRINSQVARDVEIAIPVELNKTQAIELVKEFVITQFVSQGMIADVNIHMDNPENPHAHILLTTREISQTGFTEKNRTWNSKAKIAEWRKSWAELANHHLCQAGYEVKIDHRSYDAQGIKLIPTIHRGKAVNEMQRQGIVTNIGEESQKISRANLRKIAQDPRVLFDKLSSQQTSFSDVQLCHELGKYIEDKGRFLYQEESAINEQDFLTPEKIRAIFDKIHHHESVFTERELAKELFKYTDNAEELSHALIRLKGSEELIYLGLGEDGRDHYTTKTMFDLENNIQTVAENLHARKRKAISQQNIERSIAKYQYRLGKDLTSEQLKAIQHIVRSERLSCLVGKAGTGKSFLLGAAKEIWEDAGCKVMGIALSGVAADNLQLQVGSGINSRTIESFNYACRNNRIQLTSKHVVVMDEAGMTDSQAMFIVLNEIAKAGAKLVLVGDYAQLQPVGAGATFRAIVERVGFAEIHNIYRQQQEWQMEATVHFSLGAVVAGLEAYHEHGNIRFAEDKTQAQAKLMSDWVELAKTNDLREILVLAYRNQDVAELNQQIRQLRIDNQEISDGYLATTSKGEISVSKGDRIMFLKNDRDLKVNNGQFATVTAVSPMESGRAFSITAVLDGQKTAITFDLERYNHISHSYATTVHKAQGTTVDHTLVYAGGIWDRNLTYVALSRHRKNAHLYVDKTEHKDMEQLKKHLGRLRIKDSVLDFPLTFATRRNLPEPNSKRFASHVARKINETTSRLKERIAEWKNPEGYWRKKQEEALKAQDAAQKEEAIQSTLLRREDARLVAAYVDNNREIGKSWQELSVELQNQSADHSLEEKTSGKNPGKQKGKKEQKLEQLLRIRNQQAFNIVQDFAKYEYVLDIYGLDRVKLTIQAERYKEYTLIEKYAALHTNNIMARDKLAYTIINDIKKYYPEIKRHNIDNRLIRQQAQAYLQRKTLCRMSYSERKAFEKVYKYQRVTAQIAILLKKKHKQEEMRQIWEKDSTMHILSHNQALWFTNLTKKREELAHKIVNGGEEYYKALSYFRIGEASSQFGETVDDKAIQLARLRLEKLNQCAVRHEARERVCAYIEASHSENIEERIKLAHAIRANTKLHFGTIVECGVNTKEMWGGLKRDAALYERYKFYSSLPEQEKSLFAAVDAYVRAKTAHAAAWRNYFEQKENQGHENDQSILAQQLATSAKQQTKERNKLAAAIIDNLTPCKPYIEYFNLDIDELNNKAYQHKVFETVENYGHTTDRSARATIAKQIVADPKAHHKELLEHNIAWNDVYKDVRIIERKELFATLSAEEKLVYRLAEKYRVINRQAGINYAKHKQIGRQVQKDALNVKQAKIDHLFVKRNRLAWRLVEAINSDNASADKLEYFAQELKLNSAKLLQQHKIYAQKQEKTHLKIIQRDKTTRTTQYQAQKERLKPQTQAVSRADSRKPHVVVDVQRIKQELNAQAEKVALHYLGTPKERQSNALRYGTHHGSFVVTTKGAKQGSWFDFQTGQGGDILSLIAYATNNTDFRKVIEEATNFLGDKSTYVVDSNAKTLRSNDKEKVKETTQSNAERIAKAQTIAKQTQPIVGTIAEKYLRQHRGITTASLSDDLRFHPNLLHPFTHKEYPALVGIARDGEGQICAIQATYLDSNTYKKAIIEQTKITRGVLSDRHCGVLINKGKQGATVLLAEGIETALSLKEADPAATIYATLGIANFAHIPISKDYQKVVICADNDGVNSQSTQLMEKAAETLAARGVEVWVTQPLQAKQDFNDVLKLEGVEGVRNLLNEARRCKAVELEKEVATLSSDVGKGNKKTDMTKKGLISENAKQELLDYVRKLIIFDDSVGKSNVDFEVKAMRDYQHKATEIADNKDLWSELNQAEDMYSTNIAKAGGLRKIEEKLQTNQISKEELGMMCAHIRSASSSLKRSRSKTRGRGR